MSINIDAGIINLDDPLADLPSSAVSDLRKLFMIAFAIILFIEFGVIFVLFWLSPMERPNRGPGTALKSLIVLGSGGHTAEMLKLVGSLNKDEYKPRVYVSATTDALSGKKAAEAEKTYQSDGKAKDFELVSIPRSREVGQSYITSVFTTIRATITAIATVIQIAPDVILVNGPGTCIPICIAAALFRFIHLRYTEIVYVESIARVKTLSLTGTILYKLRIADVIMVQWPELQKKYPKAQYVDRLY